MSLKPSTSFFHCSVNQTVMTCMKFLGRLYMIALKSKELSTRKERRGSVCKGEWGPLSHVLKFYPKNSGKSSKSFKHGNDVARFDFYQDCSFPNLSNPICHNTRRGCNLLASGVLHLVSLPCSRSRQTHAPQQLNRAKHTNENPRNLIVSLSCLKSFNDFLMPWG